MMKATVLFLSFFHFVFLSAQKAIVSTPNSVVVYIGIQNPIDIYYRGVATKDLVIKEYNGCEITKNGQQYFLNPNSSLKNCSFLVGIKSGQVIKWVDTAILPVRYLPKGEARFGELSNGSYTREEVMIQTQLTYHTHAYLKDLEKNTHFTQWRIILMPKNGPLELMSFSDASISEQTKAYLGKLKSGDMIIMDGIKIKIFGQELSLLPITITIIENNIPPSVLNESYSEQDFRLDSINDSTYYYESYFPDGKIYQQGKVVIETKSRSYIYEMAENQILKEPYMAHLMNIHEGCYPASEWNVFDSTGHHIMSVNYTAVRETNFKNSTKTVSGSDVKNYRIVPDGKCTFYTRDGGIEKIIYYNKGIKR